MKNMNPVVHFEMPAEDSKRMANFYSRVFGWKTQELGDEYDGYVLATTSETDEEGMLKETGCINGGFYPKKNDWPAQYPNIVIAVDDLKQSIKKIEESGGKVLGEPMNIPGYGTYISFYDTEGNRVSIIEPPQEMKEAHKPGIKRKERVNS